MKFMVISLIIFQPSWSSRSLSWSSATSTRHATLACHVASPDYLPLPFARPPKELDHLLDHHDHHLTPTPPSHTLCSWLSTDSLSKTPTQLFQAISYGWEWLFISEKNVLGNTFSTWKWFLLTQAATIFLFCSLSKMALLVPDMKTIYRSKIPLAGKSCSCRPLHWENAIFLKCSKWAAMECWGIYL